MSDSEQIIQLDQFLKVIGLVSTGGQAKVVIQGGAVMLNGEVETRRKKKLHHGDIVTYEGESHPVDFSKLGRIPRSS